METSFPTVFLLVIFSKIIVCDGFCSKDPECLNSLPEKIKWWKTKEYGLEISGDVRVDKKLEGYEASTQIQVNKIGRPQMKASVNDLIVRNRKNKDPDFTIHKLDPISYVFAGKKMLITFTNVKIINLHTYDNKTSDFSQKGIYERGDYNIDKETREKIQTASNDKTRKDPVPSSFINRIKMENEELYILNRRDVKWTINIKANFLSVNPKTKKPQPITFVANFKIQPDKRDENAAADDQTLRSKGRVKIEFHNLEFGTQLTITHTDDPLREFFDSKIKSDNLVPDLNIDYKIDEVKILEDSIKLLPYDQDDDFSKKMDEREHVNYNVPEPKPAVEKQPSKEDSEEILDTISPSVEKPKYLEDDEEKKMVVQHFKVLADLVITNTKDFSRRMCINLIPKMAWKIMHMEHKRQLPNLFHEIIAYNDDFQEKAPLEPVPRWAFISQGVSMLKGWVGLVKFPDPVSLDDED
ncbi:uncharacterized protein LOC135833166 [Planococcus citri]|uniref:uncharacterized protein LOC135833166 n=1 Tax=Planococcus citri TaxID=170843 RepID=UPI0031F86BF0